MSTDTNPTPPGPPLEGPGESEGAIRTTEGDELDALMGKLVAQAEERRAGRRKRAPAPAAREARVKAPPAGQESLEGLEALEAPEAPSGATTPLAALEGIATRPEDLWKPHVLRAVRDLRRMKPAGDPKFGERASKALRDVLGGVLRGELGRWERELALASAPAGVPRIEVTPHEWDVGNDLVRALSARTDVYQRGGMLVHAVRDQSPLAGIVRAPGTPRVVELSPAHLRGLAAAAAWFFTLREEKETKQLVAKHEHPPQWAVLQVHARGQWDGIRPLEGISEVPVLRPDGSVCAVNGYDAATGVLVDLAGEFPAVPEAPTLDDARAALEVLREPFVDFPFATPAHRACAIAGVMTPLARTAFRGPAPLFLWDANTRGSGKSLGTDVTSEITAGRPMARMAPVDDDGEMRKRITALAISGVPMVLIDNVAGSLGGPSLDGALTSETWRDRVLGASRDVELPLAATWYATGNNVALSGDLSRRVAHVRLESPEEHPEERTEFRHPDLLGWVRAHRGELVTAALTILRAFILAGRPAQHIAPWGSFEGWSRLVRHALVWAGEADPGETREALRAQADVAAGAKADLVAGWEEIAVQWGGQCTTAQVLDELAKNDAASGGTFPSDVRRYETLRAALAELCPTPPGRLPTPRQVGNALKRFKDSVSGGKALTMVKATTKSGAVWAVRAVTRPGAVASEPVAPAPSLPRVRVVQPAPPSAPHDPPAPPVASPPRRSAPVPAPEPLERRCPDHGDAPSEYCPACAWAEGDEDAWGDMTTEQRRRALAAGDDTDGTEF